MPGFSDITIFYNPQSTGPSKAQADRFARQLEAVGLEKIITVVGTKHAGHAETLSYKIAKESKRPLIISSSGDGGYNEVINGILQANSEGAQATAGLLPSGNANDHYTFLHQPSVIKRIVAADTRTIDVLLVRCTGGDKKPWERYAHSYVGIGLTPYTGKQLTAAKLNAINEKIIVLRSLLSLRPDKILINGQVRMYDSLVFSNIGKMSKFLKLSKHAAVDDGKFEINAVHAKHRLHLFRAIIAYAAGAPTDPKQANHFSFETTKSLDIQLDGEVHTLPANATVEISIVPTSLACII